MRCQSFREFSEKKEPGGLDMVSNVSVRAYKPRQQTFSRKKQWTDKRIILNLSSEAGKIILGMLAVAMVIGLISSHILHGQISTLSVQAEQLRADNKSTADENVRLLAARAQLTSRTHVAALAGTKLNLYEPDKGQVRRM
jgi:cell division protein FtsL